MKSSTKHFFTAFFFALVFFTLTVCANAANERESNDNINSANSISVNEHVYGSVESWGNDYFKFTLSTDGYLNITYNQEASDNTSIFVSVELLDINNKTLNTMSIRRTAETTTSSNVGLPAGTYYIGLSNSHHQYDYEYDFIVNFVSASDWEKEHNDSIANSTSIKPNQTYYGCLRIHDKDVYDFTINQNGTVCLTINHEYYDSTSAMGYARIFTYDGTEQNKLYEYKVKLNSQTSTTLKLGLPAGKYFFEFESDSRSYERPYNFKVNYAAADNWEITPNYKLTDATAVQIGKTYNGSLYGIEDDHYSFTVDKNSTLKVTFNHKYTDSASTFAYIEIMSYDGSSETLLSEFSSKCNNKTTSSSVSLPAGQYYIVISKASAENAEYNFMIEYTTNAVVSPDSTGVSNIENEAESNTPTHTNHDESVTPNNGIADIEINHEEQSNTTIRHNGNSISNSNNNNKNTVEIPISAIVALVAVVIIAAGGAVIFLIIKKQKNN